ncbi:(+)-neomenthol dehydrogenase-like isoform X1 [Phoenix dactylifera]|uniref:(+)-neomenthol dehydrogenase-like isoform X1 n=2 Tax=Phoenix dactylifera TaxID=42345 RepID=A0A8B9A347_PHODC|nr:(+)-neomenthol dehydrogenase-like isoform X1 [Phoenix dactylifera]
MNYSERKLLGSEIRSALAFFQPSAATILRHSAISSSHPLTGAFFGVRKGNRGLRSEKIPGATFLGITSSSRQQAMGSNERPNPDRLAVVTGANKGIGLETARQLASHGVTVILTARDEKRGTDAVESLHQVGFSNVVFHQLDVRDPASVASLAHFIQNQFGKLDILVNNAGASGVVVDVEGLKALNIDPESWLSGKATNIVQAVIRQDNEDAVTCLDTNYYGVKRVTEALLPVLMRSTSGARIVNVSSLRSELKRMPNESIRNQLNDIDNLNEEKIEKLLDGFLEDLKNGTLEAGGWPMMLPSYSVSKTVLNAYTRVLAKRYPDMCINCVHPGYVKTDINWNTGVLATEEGAKGPVMLALLPNGGPSGCYFDQTTMAEY